MLKQPHRESKRKSYSATVILLHGVWIGSGIGCHSAVPRSPGVGPTATNSPSAGEATLIQPAAPQTRAAASQPVTSRPASAAPSPQENARRYLESVLRRCTGLTSYTTELVRYERRGLLLKSMHGPEHIAAWFRQEPFSVRFRWLDPDVKHGEAVYIAGRYDNRLRFVPRKWIPPVFPGINTVDVQTPVTWGETLNPVTDFGLRRLAERMALKLEAAGPAASVEYRDRVRLPETESDAYCLSIEFPRQPAFPQPSQLLYVDCESGLPAGIVMRRADGALHAAYYYTRLNERAALTEDDFVLDYERQNRRGAAPSNSGSDDRAAQ